MSQHDCSFSFHIHTPSKIEKKVAETKHHGGIMEIRVDLTKVSEGPGTCDKSRSKAERGREKSMDSSYQSAVPLSRSFAVESMEKKVRISPQ